MLVLHYDGLGQIRLRRSNDPHSVPTILRPIGQVTRVVKKSHYGTPLCQVRLGQVKAVQRSTFGPTIHRPIGRLIRFGLTMVLHYIMLGQIRLRQSNDPHSICLLTQTKSLVGFNFILELVWNCCTLSDSTFDKLLVLIMTSILLPLFI